MIGWVMQPLLVQTVSKYAKRRTQKSYLHKAQPPTTTKIHTRRRRRRR
jgi:hypothetical protein